ncbi:hypothetical protein EV421DRAFT_2031166 [Armillaria borealis]|uniref:F-box domain-containing protein n=1 Tax=Armillaria borealis TaxID=47425 RepID=A0AA39K109_9AGAR|nr:hypothetical protein EV421DRAFT_2031166 [Armillaria borealis]
MTLETNLHTTPAPPPAADALSSWDAFLDSIPLLPQPVLPSESEYSQVLGILRATRPLLDNDRDWIPPNIALLEGQLPVYETLIDRLDTALEELQALRDMMREVSKEFPSTLAPIRRLPSDVLRSVFRETQSDLDGRGSSCWPTIKFTHDTLTLAQVCASWRDIVVSSPELWSDIKITFPSLTVDNPGRSPLLKTILPLSGQLPLDIRLVSDGDTSSGEAIEAFSSLLRERHRWRSASLKLPLDLLEQLRASSGKLPCLESLTLMTPRSRWDRRSLPAGDVSDVFIDAPSLHKVVWHQSIGYGSFAFPSQITHLAASFTFIHNLHIHTLLEELHLEVKHDDDIAFLHRITLPKVRRLSVSSLKSLRHLSLPSLEDLAFDRYSVGILPFAHDDVEAAAEILNDFIRSSHCSLTSLATRTSIVYAPNSIQETLPLLESLTSLAFEIDDVSEPSFYDTLMSPNVLPNLQFLIMRLPKPGIEDIFQDALSTMLASRRLSVRIEYPIMRDNKHVGILNRLEPLRQLGVDLRVEDTGSSFGISFGKFA